MKNSAAENFLYGKIACEKEYAEELKLIKAAWQTLSIETEKLRVDVQSMQQERVSRLEELDVKLAKLQKLVESHVRRSDKSYTEFVDIILKHSKHVDAQYPGWREEFINKQ